MINADSLSFRLTYAPQRSSSDRFDLQEKVLDLLTTFYICVSSVHMTLSCEVVVRVLENVVLVA